MPAPAHTKITVKGIYGDSLNAPVEQWQWTVAFDAVGYASDAAREAAAVAVFGAYATNLVPHYRAHIKMNTVRVAEHGADGRTLTNSDGSYRAKDVVSGSGYSGSSTGGQAYPTTVAQVISFTTSRAGASGKGRVFSPAPNYSLESDFRISATASVDAASRWKQFLNALNESTDVLGNACVVSNRLAVLTPITGVKVGRTLDTMRSRRRSMLEGYSSLTLA